MPPEAPPARFVNDSFYRTILDAIPVPVFVVDDDVQIRDLNAAAANLIGLDQKASYRRRGGDVLHCLHATDVAEGCGRGPACQECAIRNLVTQCLTRQTITRKRVNLQVMRDSVHVDVHVLMTVSPLPDDGERLAILMIEDITEINALKSLIPMCMKCKKVRDDQDCWKDMDAYFQEQAGVDFSHSLCPDCKKEYYS
jgi:PAS domain-containing protein